MTSFDTLVDSILKENSKSLSNFKEDFNSLDPLKQSSLRKAASNYLKDQGVEEIGSSDISNQLMSWYKSYHFDLNDVLEDLTESILPFRWVEVGPGVEVSNRTYNVRGQEVLFKREKDQDEDSVWYYFSFIDPKTKKRLFKDMTEKEILDVVKNDK